jgi:hypothetical protein
MENNASIGASTGQEKKSDTDFFTDAVFRALRNLRASLYSIKSMTDIVETDLQNPTAPKSALSRSLLPGKCLRSEITIRSSNNNRYLVHIGCNTWVADTPEEVAFFLLAYLASPNTLERAMNYHDNLTLGASLAGAPA